MVKLKVKIRNDLLPKISSAELKYLEKGGLWDGWEHRSYRGGSILGARSSSGSVTEALSCLDTCHDPVRVIF